MSTSQLFLIAAVVGFTVIAIPYAGWAGALIGGYILTLGGVTTSLYVMNGTLVHFGIARSAPTIYLGDVLLVAAVLAIWAHGGRLRVGWLLAIFGLPALIFLFTVWGATPEQYAGLKLYVTALVSFGIGRWLGDNITDRTALVIVWACVAACGLQFVLAFAQSQGVTLIAESRDAAHWISQGRMVGLYAHPAILGKSMVLLFCFLLPLSVSGQRVTRRLAYLAITLGSIATLLTLSRANSVAIGVAIILWIILSGRASSTSSRVGVIAAAGVLIALNANAIAGLQLRQAADPNGGFRSQTDATGLDQILSAPLSGTGPNYYGEVVGTYDHLAASGFPLHNAFLFPMAELGIPLGLIFLLPLLLTLVRTVRRIRLRQMVDVRSATLLSVLPGIAVIAWTGWGLIATESLPLWFMAFGFLASSKALLDIDERGSDRRESRARSTTPVPV